MYMNESLREQAYAHFNCAPTVVRGKGRVKNRKAQRIDRIVDTYIEIMRNHLCDSPEEAYRESLNKLGPIAWIFLRTFLWQVIQWLWERTMENKN